MDNKRQIPCDASEIETKTQLHEIFVNANTTSWLVLIDHPETDVNKYASSKLKSANVPLFTHYYLDMLQREIDIDL